MEVAEEKIVGRCRRKDGGHDGFGYLHSLVFPLPFHACVALRWWRTLCFAVQEKRVVG